MLNLDLLLDEQIESDSYKEQYEFIPFSKIYDLFIDIQRIEYKDNKDIISLKTMYKEYEVEFRCNLYLGTTTIIIL